MITTSRFSPAWWLANRHLQTIIPNTFRALPRQEIRRERIELPDGDFVDADWTAHDSGPVVVLLHGLEGSRRSRYAAWMLKRLHDAGYRGVLLHFRGCSGELNRKANGYHSGHTADFDHFLQLLRAREPEVEIAAIGYSLGGNALLKWLGENPGRHCLRTAIAVSVPFRLGQCSDAINRGFSRVYQKHLLKRMLRTARSKLALIRHAGHAPDLDAIRNFRDFDEALTAPLHGFRSATDYYLRSSSAQFLRHITTPTLVIHASDDPFMTPDTVPRDDELSPCVSLELSAHGGHVGFVSGRWPWKPRYWLEERVLAHLDQQFPARDAGMRHPGRNVSAETA
ncbi:MAG TPA: hydrolase [Gammaproteobacteria bacterium]